MGVISGVKAAVKYDSTVIGCARYWELYGECIDNAAACSGSDGAIVRGDGNKDWRGHYIAYGYQPVILPGQKFQFAGADRDDQGWQSADDGAIVSEAHIYWPIEQGGFIFHRVDFESNGSLTAGEYTVADASIPAPTVAKGRTLSLGAVEVTDLGYIEIILKSNNTRPVWTSSNSGWPVRESGNLEAEVIWKHYFDAYTAVPALNAAPVITVDATDALTYVLTWCQIAGYRPVYDIQGRDNVPKLVGEEVRARFTGYYGGAKGSILLPDSSYFWN